MKKEKIDFVIKNYEVHKSIDNKIAAIIYQQYCNFIENLSEKRLDEIVYEIIDRKETMKKINARFYENKLISR